MRQDEGSWNIPSDPETCISQSRVLISMMFEGAKKVQVSHLQSVLERNAELTVLIEAVNAKGGKATQEEQNKKAIHVMEIHTNMHEAARIFDEIAGAVEVDNEEGDGSSEQNGDRDDGGSEQSGDRDDGGSSSVASDAICMTTDKEMEEME